MKRCTLLLGILLAAVACGSGQSGDPKSAAMFVGKWTASLQSAQSVQCGAQSVAIPLWGNVTISPDTSNPGGIITQPDNGCILHWVCNGDTASVVPNSTCGVPVPLTNGQWQATFLKGTLTLGSNLISLQDNGAAVYTVNSAAQNCTFEQSGSFTNTSN